MCREIALEGNVVVKRPDAKELIAVRKGQKKLKEIILEVEDNLTVSKEKFKSNLPDKVDKEDLNLISQNVFCNFLGVG